MYKILIAGIGGVGGYFGGLLSKEYESHNDIEISFFARGAHLQEIKDKGLKVVKGGNEFRTRPKLSSNKPNDIGIVNCLIVCTKVYDLEEIIEQLTPCIDNQTIILPLLNGVDSSDRIKSVLPNAQVLNGCAYIISKIKAPGVVENFGNIQTLYFGIDQKKPTELVELEKLLITAGIEAIHTDQISKVKWEKYIFISATATATSYFKSSIGEILSDNNKCSLLKELINEVTQIAKAKGVAISVGIQKEVLRKLESLPFETTSSMQRDFMNGNRTEVSSLTEFVVKTGLELNVRTEVYTKMLEKLLTQK